MLDTRIREKFETMLSVRKHCNLLGQKTDDGLLDERLGSQSGNLSSNLGSVINKLCDIQQIVIGFASVFSAIIEVVE